MGPSLCSSGFVSRTQPERVITRPAHADGVADQWIRGLGRSRPLFGGVVEAVGLGPDGLHYPSFTSVKSGLAFRPFRERPTDGGWSPPSVRSPTGFAARDIGPRLRSGGNLPSEVQGARRSRAGSRSGWCALLIGGVNNFVNHVSIATTGNGDDFFRVGPRGHKFLGTLSDAYEYVFEQKREWREKQARAQQGLE